MEICKALYISAVYDFFNTSHGVALIKCLYEYGKHPVVGQLVVVVYLALKRPTNITASNNVIFELVRDTGTGGPYFDLKFMCQIARATFL